MIFSEIIAGVIIVTLTLHLLVIQVTWTTRTHFKTTVRRACRPVEAAMTG